MLVPLTYINKE